MGTGVLPEQHEPGGIDAKLAGPAPDERQGPAEIRQRLFVTRQPAEPVVDGEPVIARRCQELEELSDVSGPTAGCPGAAVDDDYRRTRAGARLNVSVERQLPGVRDVALDARDDVVAVSIADVERRAGLRERCRRTRREQEQE